MWTICHRQMCLNALSLVCGFVLEACKTTMKCRLLSKTVAGSRTFSVKAVHQFLSVSVAWYDSVWQATKVSCSFCHYRFHPFKLLTNMNSLSFGLLFQTFDQNQTNISCNLICFSDFRWTAEIFMFCFSYIKWDVIIVIFESLPHALISMSVRIVEA